MAKTPQTEPELEPVIESSDPLIITESELLLLSEKERNEFRHKGGTVTSDPPL